MSPLLIPITALLIPIVALVTRYMIRARELQAQGLSDNAAGDLLARADRLEQRVQQLERLLDAESPGWRARA
ncbi:envelope stress response membrane protein PspB [Nitrospirillum sp. BR 11828]|uniref:envelope stress response membrane protein PspB n=1 Tax=Nitrospirillum sp. BR 11828 TaxID=3104325 RepID=UPI002ACAAC7F|nr:envelope stress response membrane protein PspB [Nitrospirillum sp. BR 11828]MDZ5646664.1 envelope stress response membrane protein PspB [Nitrospirillum sp. BR 11828]